MKELKASGNVRHLMSSTVIAAGFVTAALSTAVAAKMHSSDCFLSFVSDVRCGCVACM